MPKLLGDTRSQRESLHFPQFPIMYLWQTIRAFVRDISSASSNLFAVIKDAEPLELGEIKELRKLNHCYVVGTRLREIEGTSEKFKS